MGEVLARRREIWRLRHDLAEDVDRVPLIAEPRKGGGAGDAELGIWPDRPLRLQRPFGQLRVIMQIEGRTQRGRPKLRRVRAGNERLAIAVERLRATAELGQQL